MGWRRFPFFKQFGVDSLGEWGGPLISPWTYGGVSPTKPPINPLLLLLPPLLKNPSRRFSLALGSNHLLARLFIHAHNNTSFRQSS